MAVARKTDPDTSWAAAKRIKAREAQEAVYDVLLTYGPMTDSKISSVYNEVYKAAGLPFQYDSGLRSRRDELVKQDRVYFTGKKAKLPSGNLGRVWCARA